MLKLYTMKALAKTLGLNYDNMRQVVYRLTKQSEEPSYKGYRLISVGDGKRLTWLAHPEKQKVQVITEDDLPEGFQNS